MADKPAGAERGSAAQPRRSAPGSACRAALRRWLRPSRGGSARPGSGNRNCCWLRARRRSPPSIAACARVTGLQRRHRRAGAAAVGAAEDRDHEITRSHIESPDKSLVLTADFAFGSEIASSVCRARRSLPTLEPMAGSETQAERSRTAGFAALWRFLPMLWPKGEAELKARVIVAVCWCSPARRSTLLGPYALKLAVDRMSAPRGVRGRRRAGRSPMPAPASAACCRTICATRCSRRSGRTRRGGSPARSSATSTICRCASISSGAPDR